MSMEIEWPETCKTNTFGELNVGDWFIYIVDEKTCMYMKTEVINKVYNVVSRYGVHLSFKDDKNIEPITLYARVGAKK